MRPEQLRALLIDAVPPLAAPPDRIQTLAKRVSRRRTRTAVLTVVTATLAVAGRAIATRTLLPARQPGHVAPAAGRSGPVSTVGVGRCPDRVDLMHQSAARIAGDTDAAVPVPLGSVTLCRYVHGAFDLSAPDGIAELRAGPATGDPGEFGTLINQYLAQLVYPSQAPSAGSAGSGSPAGSGASGSPAPNRASGCLMPSPTANVSVDIVFAVDPTGHAHEYLLPRVTCANPDAAQPARQLDAAIDQLLGPPY